MTKKIFIISLEGIESNTEVNFYNGFFYHLQGKIEGNCIALGKLSKKQNMQEKFKDRIEMALRENENFIKDSNIFFIGDGMPKKDIESMERARNFTMNHIRTKKININRFSKLIYDKEKSFEDILNSNPKIKNSKLLDKKNQKKKSNRRFFNDILEKVGLGNLENKKGELKSFLNEVFKNSNFKKIIDFIYN